MEMLERFLISLPGELSSSKAFQKGPSRSDGSPSWLWAQVQQHPEDPVSLGSWDDSVWSPREAWEAARPAEGQVCWLQRCSAHVNTGNPNKSEWGERRGRELGGTSSCQARAPP